MDRSSFMLSLIGKPTVVPLSSTPMSRLQKDQINAMLYDGQYSCFNEEVRLSGVRQSSVDDLLRSCSVYGLVGDYSILGIACVSEGTAFNRLHTFCIKEGLRSKGFGNMLLDKILALYERIRLTVYRRGSQSDRLIRLYKSKGFREDETQETTLGDYIQMKNF